MDLVLISNPEFFPGEHELVEALMQQFRFTFHLRKPQAHDEEYEDFLRDIPDRWHHRIVLHGAYKLREKYNLKGLHFSAKNRTQAGEYLHHGTQSTSCHTITEARHLDGYFDYFFLSPVFPSISKPGYRGKLDPEETKRFLSEKRQTKVIALGGIDEQNITKLKEFDGIALLGAVWTTHPDRHTPVQFNMEKIIRCLNDKP